MVELSTLVDVFCSCSDDARTEEDVAIFASTVEEDATVVESVVVSELSRDIFSIEEDEDVLMVFKDVFFTLDSDDDLISFLEVAVLVCLVSCLAELLVADPADLARDVVFVIATVFRELLPVFDVAGGFLGLDGFGFLSHSCTNMLSDKYSHWP